MVSVLDYERSELGFESRRPESDFTSTHQKTEEKSAVPWQRHLQPLATITPDEAQQLQRPSNYNYHARTIYITHTTSELCLLLQDFHVYIVCVIRNILKFH